MRFLRWSVIAVILAVLASIWGGCNEDNSPVLDSLPPSRWIIYKDGEPITDTIWGFRNDCLIEIPAAGGTYRIQCTEDCNFEDYEIVQPTDHRGLLTVAADDRYDYPKFFDVTYAPNQTGASRLFTLRCYGIRHQNVLLVSAYQPPMSH